MSQPSPRTLGSAPRTGLVIFSTASGESTRVPRDVPPDRSIRQKIARSAAVLNRPA
jgi:hypothetical protein